MKMAIRINSSNLRGLCIEHMWCTGMTIEEYSDMLDTCGVFETMDECEQVISHIADEIIRASQSDRLGGKANVMTSVFAECVIIWWESDKND